MSNVNEFDASTGSSSLRAYTTAEEEIVTTLSSALAAATAAGATVSVESESTYVSVTSSTYTVVASTEDKLIEVTHATGTTVTIPSDPDDTDFPIGWSTEFRQMGDGKITFQATSPATLASTEGYTKTRLKYSSVVIEKRASNAWILVGDIDA